jgi:flagellar biosynthesis/type III secretory pathway protein FliH
LVARKQWRCFHCDTVFTDQFEAGIHFGADLAGTCACVLPHEQHLVEHIRDLESQLQSYRDESDKVMRSIMTLETEKQRAVQNAEEAGYAKGLSDGQALRFVTTAGANMLSSAKSL